MAGLACKGLTFKSFLSGVCACLNFGLLVTLVVSLNTLFTDWLNSFGGNRGTTTAVQATCLGVTLGAGLLAGVVERRVGERVSLLLGTALASAGFLAGGFVTSLPALIVCVGVVTGSGFCLLHLSTLSTILKRFPKKAAFMSSAMATCTSMMHLGSALLYRYLSEQYTWRGALILAGGIILHTAIFSLLLTSPLFQSSTTEPPRNCSSSQDHDVTPFIQGSDVTSTTAVNSHHLTESTETKHNDGRDRQNLFKIKPFDTNGEPSVAVTSTGDATEVRFVDEHVRSRRLVLSDQLDLTESDQTKPLRPPLSNQEPAHATEKHAADHCSSRFKSNVAFLKEPLYICVLLCTVVPLSTIVCFVFLVLDFATHQGWSVGDGILLNMVFQLSGLVSRLTVCLVSLHSRVRSIIFLITAGVIGSIGMCFLGQASSLHIAAVLYVCLGAGHGALVGMYPAAVLEVIGPGPAYPVALGLVCTMEGTLDAGIGILTGFLVDMLKSYRLISIVYGIISLASSLLLLVVFLCRRSRRSEV